jgi:hypothetical protein
MKIQKDTPNFNPLSLTVSKNPFSAIASGVKKEEYREIKPYWDVRLKDHLYTHIEFRNGYQVYSPRILIKLISISIGTPDPKFCFGIIDPTKEVYILKLGEIIESTS